MLWTDDYAITIDDLNAIDPEVGDVASSQGITMTGANGVIDKSLQEASAEILANMQRFGGYLTSGFVSANHLAAVHNVGGPSANRTRVLTNQIVVQWGNLPPVFALKNWLIYRCLVNFFRMASNRVQVPRERFQEKRDEYDKEIRYKYWPTVQGVGLPMVYRPLMAPGALFEIEPGSWSVGTSVKAGTTGGQFDVAITYVDQTYYIAQDKRYNAESATAASQTIDVDAGEAIVVDISSLNPPTAQVQDPNVPMNIVTPLKATGWNVWAGQHGGKLYLQNSSPILIGDKTFTLPGDPILTGFVSHDGQFPDAYYTIQNTLQRG